MQQRKNDNDPVLIVCHNRNSYLVQYKFQKHCLDSGKWDCQFPIIELIPSITLLILPTVSCVNLKSIDFESFRETTKPYKQKIINL